MIVGMNHSGKTTFARQLEQKVNNLVVVENDVRREFAEKNYRKLRDISRE
jgi:uridine kinase